MAARSLSDFRVGAKPVQPWAPPGTDQMAYGGVLAVDQSLSALGWVWLQHTPETLCVVSKGSVRTNPGDFPKGHEGNLQRAVAVYEEFRTQIFAQAGRMHEISVVHEAPPVGSHMSRPESSLISATVIRIWAYDQGLPLVMVANQHSKSILVHNANATKKEWHTALDRLLISGHKVSNEGERDALCLALTYLIDQKGAS